MDIDLRPARVSFTYLRRDGTVGRASTEVWADSLRDARRLSPKHERNLRVTAQWVR